MAREIRTPEERERMRAKAAKENTRLTAEEKAAADRLVDKCEAELDRKNDGTSVMVETAGFSEKVINEVVRRYRAQGYGAEYEYDERVFHDKSVDRLTITPPATR